MGGDVDAAIEVLVAEEGSSDHIIVEAEPSPLVETSNGNGWLLSSIFHLCYLQLLIVSCMLTEYFILSYVSLHM